MIVRTYGRRNRGITRTYSDTTFSDDPFGGSLSLSQEKEQSPPEIYNFSFSSQDSTRWTFDSDPAASNSSQNSLQLLSPIPESDDCGRKAKRLKNGKKRVLSTPVTVVPATATLMETQEFGEMMEHMDEVNFALDGLRKRQPVRIRRASLLSLLSICGSVAQRRLLRAQGIAKKIVDAILGLNLDDSTSNLAAAALFYILTNDGQDDYPLDSPSCINFLLKLLKQLVDDPPEDKAPAMGHRLLAFRKDVHVEQGTTTRLDTSSAAIISKVKEILMDCKDMKASNENDVGIPRPELNARWIALLTIEKASLSTISIEDTSGTVRKSGGNFKEELREMGGLDAVFELAMSFHSIMEGWLENLSLQTTEPKEDERLECLALLLRCLKIMENATFLSQENQNHLLGMERKLARRGPVFSCTKLIISFIKILSGLSLRKSSSTTASPEIHRNFLNGSSLPEFPCMAVQTDGGRDSSLQSSIECSSSGRTLRGADILESARGLSSSRFASLSLSCETSTSTKGDNSVIKMRPSSSSSTSCSLGMRVLDGGTLMVGVDNSRKKLDSGSRPFNITDSEYEDLEDSEDPFAFDEGDYEPSRWDALSGRKHKVSQKRKSRLTTKDLEYGCLSEPMFSEEESNNEEFRTQRSKQTCGNLEDACPSQPMLSQEDSHNEGNNHSSQTSCSSVANAESTNLADCLLTAVKVLMNLTNDNAEGCRQIAAGGGLETLASLIAFHFPSFSSPLSPLNDLRETTLLSDSALELGSQTDIHLNDQELDFLVAILGLLVNLVEKDSHNRSRLAAASVSLPCSRELESDTHRGVIPLFCSVFLANQGAGEATEEGKTQRWEDAEEVVLRGEKEAEKMIVEAYSALLLAFLSTESKTIRDSIADYLPDNSLAVLVPVLERFVAFHLALDMISPETHKTVYEVIESCRDT
ncbi:hypothetical protein Dimus_035200 [Dionaea muscipula]